MEERLSNCEFCNKLISVTYMKKHCRRFHNIYDNRKRRITCCICKQAFRLRKQLLDHVPTHNVQINRKLLSFKLSKGIYEYRNYLY